MLYNIVMKSGKVCLFVTMVFMVFLTLLIGIGFFMNNYRIIAAIAWVTTFIAANSAGAILRVEVGKVKA